MYFKNILYFLFVLYSIGLPADSANYWDFQNCEFIDIDEDISRDIFVAYMDGRNATGVNFDALEIEVTDDTLRN